MGQALDKGKIIQHGTHAQLAAGEGSKYQLLWHMQIGLFKYKPKPTEHSETESDDTEHEERKKRYITTKCGIRTLTIFYYSDNYHD